MECSNFEQKTMPADNDKPSNKYDSAYKLTCISLALFIIGIDIPMFLIALDSSVISTAISRVTSNFHSTGSIAWYESSYIFAMCSLQPMAGKSFLKFPHESTYLEYKKILARQHLE